MGILLKEVCTARLNGEPLELQSRQREEPDGASLAGSGIVLQLLSSGEERQEIGGKLEG
jgi:hypothetical protein